MEFNLKKAEVNTVGTTYNGNKVLGIRVLIDNQGNAVVVQNDLFHFLNEAGEIKSKGTRKRFVYINSEHSLIYNSNDFRTWLSVDDFNRLYLGRIKKGPLKLLDYDTAVKAIEKHYHGPQAGILLRVLLDCQHQVHARKKIKVSKKFTPSKHKTKDEVIDNLKQSNAKWEQAVNEKAAAYKKLTVENESLHNKLAAAAVDNDELKVRNTKLNNEVAELKSTLYDRTVNDTKKSWWQNVKGVFSR